MQDQVKSFCQKYNLYKENEIQQIQLRHRFELVKAFGIQEGMRVLEIGCGQGNTTVVLADIVGDTGHVLALDIAASDYGAPLTLAQAHAQIQSSPLGKRISFHLETDFLTFHLLEDIDVVVLSHSSWYFKSMEQLLQYFQRAKQLGVKLCFAEWDMAYTSLQQRSHFCAVSILALYSAFIENEGNIQNVWSKSQSLAIAETANFQLKKSVIVEADYLQDGGWERDYANAIADEFEKAPLSIQALIKSYIEVMNETQEVASLNSFVQVFE
ncbi:MAG: class I SAM-dependent methyltransferase [Lysinibacillus fusiformis]|nr:class I SAM-dependent methyltransferase [Lysinibacillus fusiformis]MCT6929169.1 class I SAM-dependent methyltransferase [Lysinibacillus fusiformis]MCT6931930.1 class I SAM-dependent methyltransferase [Lysinibacillus fusiformis]